MKTKKRSRTDPGSKPAIRLRKSLEKTMRELDDPRRWVVVSVLLKPHIAYYLPESNCYSLHDIPAEACFKKREVAGAVAAFLNRKKKRRGLGRFQVLEVKKTKTGIRITGQVRQKGQTWTPRLRRSALKTSAVQS